MNLLTGKPSQQSSKHSAKTCSSVSISLQTVSTPTFPPKLRADTRFRALSCYCAELTCVQNAQRRAAIGISLRHSGHLRVVGSAGGSRRDLAIKAFTGTTTKK